MSAFLYPDWPAPANVRALVTTRAGGASRGPYASFNLGDHVGDDPAAVARNRARLRQALELDADPRWLRQVHGTRVIEAAAARPGEAADGAWTGHRGVACAVLSADCLPVFLCDRAGTRVALLHAGWRGLAAGIIEAGLRAFAVPPEAVHIWLGPAIGADAYEVGDEVRQAFVDADAGAAGAFRAGTRGKWYMDMHALARRRLDAQGVRSIHGGGYCTASQPALFYSYRRDGATGRMASLIWLE